MRYALCRLLLAVLPVVSGCRKEPVPDRVADAAGDGHPVPECPGIGHAVPLPGGEGELKLLSFNFYRHIGAERMVSAPGGRVFALAETEWSGEAGPLLLEDSEGRRLPEAPAALDAYLAMQPEGRYGPPAEEGTAAGAGAAGSGRMLRAHVFELPLRTAMGGLFLVSGAGEGAARFCLGKYRVE